MDDRLLDQRLVLSGDPDVSNRICFVGGPGVSTRSCLSGVCDVVSDLNGENTFAKKDLDGDIYVCPTGNDGHVNGGVKVSEVNGVDIEPSHRRKQSIVGSS